MQVQIKAYSWQIRLALISCLHDLLLRHCYFDSMHNGTHNCFVTYNWLEVIRNACNYNATNLTAPGNEI